MKKLILLLVFIVGCSNKPNINDVNQVIDNIIAQNQSSYFIKIDRLQKINAVDGMLQSNSQAYYDVQTTMKIWIIRKCVWKPSYGLSAGPILFTTNDYDIVDAGTMFNYDKTFRFFKTENGWLGEDNFIY